MKFYDDTISQCFECGCMTQCARHHLIGGPYRAKADRLGLYIPLCPRCHVRIHKDKEMMLRWRAHAQVVMEDRGWTMEQWIAEFGKNYLEE